MNESRKYYYKIAVDNSDPLALICVGKDTKNFNQYRFYSGERIEDWPEDITFFCEGKHPEDLLIGGLQWRLVSKAVYQVFLDNEICGTQFLPAKVKYQKTKEEVGLYWVLNVFQELEALNWDHTHWTFPEKRDTDEYPGANIIREAFHQMIVQDFDIFRLKIEGGGTNIFISDRLKHYLISAGATSGFIFLPIPLI